MIEELNDIRQDICNKVSAMNSMENLILMILPDDFMIESKIREDLTKKDIENHFNACVKLIDKDLHRIDVIIKELKEIKSKL